MTQRMHIVCTIFLAIITVACGAQSPAGGSFPVPDRPELSLPLLGEKRIVAHYMTNMLFHKGGRYPAAYFDKAHYLPSGPTGAMGGATQTYPLMDFRADKTMDEAAEFELKAAVQTGLDGFQFFYPVNVDYKRYNAVITAFFRAADKLELDFKFTVCLCSARDGKGTAAEKIAHWAAGLKDLVERTKGLDYWLKTPDSRTIIFIWNGVGLADEIDGIGAILGDPKLIKYDARAYDMLAKASGIKTAYVFHVVPVTSNRKRVTDQLFKYYPAFWYWLPIHSLDGSTHDAFAGKCKQARRTYSATVYTDFYTSKPYRKDNKQRLWRPEEMLELGVDGMYRRVIVTGLSREFRKNFEHGIKHDVPLVNVVTWNDYPEGHQICPDINHNFSFAVLLNYYKNLWQGKTVDNQDEVGIVFFKKYPSTEKPTVADFEIQNIRGVSQTEDDFIEAITLLKQPARVFINGTDCGIAQAGLTEKRIPIQPGPVWLKVVRDDKTIISLTAPEWITDKPYRTDRFTYGYSSRYDEYWKALFRGRSPETSQEYCEKGGIPNWKRN